MQATIKEEVETVKESIAMVYEEMLKLQHIVSPFPSHID